MNNQTHDIKSQVARLMATENLDVRFADCHTASFDPNSRVLTIPNYKDDLSREEYDLFIGHEVGHALYTPIVRPDEVDTSRKGFGGFVNVCEDVRIEKAIQAKYPGLTRSFRTGYNDLIDRGFFGEDKDFDNMSLGDKANMYFKAGFHHTGITFSDEEQIIVDAMESADTWDKVVKAAQDLYDFVGHSENDKDSDDGESKPSDDKGNESNGAASGNGPGEATDADENADDSDSSSNGDGAKDDSGDGKDKDGTDTSTSGNGEESADSNGDNGDDGDNGDGDDNNYNSQSGYTPSADSITPEIKTQDSFDKKSEALASQSVNSGSGVTNGVIPEATDDVVLGWKDVYTDLKNRVEFEGNKETTDENNSLDRFTAVWKKFKSENKTIVAYLAKEFEMRKSADEHQRTRQAKTGELNTAILHTYKFNEDLFKKASVVAEGKNHGIVMVVDWSGSMGNCIVDTISQIQIMAMFCRQVNIPFDVYAFNGHYSGIFNEPVVGTSTADQAEKDPTLVPSFTSADGEIVLEVNTSKDEPEQDRFRHANRVGSFKMIQYLSSTMRLSQFENAMSYLTMIKDSFIARAWNNDMNNPLGYGGSGWHRLGGTPLTHAVVASAKIVNDFKVNNNLQVVNTIFLTDGEGSYDISLHGPSDENRSYRNDMVIHDRKTKRFYKRGSRDGYAAMFHNWLDWFHDRTGTRIINFYIYGSTKNDLNSAFRSFNIPDTRDVAVEDEFITDMAPSNKIINTDELKDLNKKGFYYRDDVAGYRSVFFIRAKNLKVAEDRMEKLDADATIAKTRKAFIGNQRDKRGSRLFMDQVAQLIA